MDAQEIKQHIIDKDLIETVLKKLECHKIKRHSKEYRCALPNKSNGTAVAVRLDTLGTSVYTEGDKVNGDILTLVMSVKGLNFIDSLRWLHQALGLQFTGRPRKKEDDKPKFDPLALFKDIKCREYKSGVDKLKVYDCSILDSYIMLPHIELIKEGISVQSQRKFNVGYDSRSKRIVFPYRYYAGCENSYVGVTGRTCDKDYELLDIPKYFALKPFSKSLTLFGLAENYEGIQQSGKVIVVEGEKSVLKLHTFGYENVVAVGSHSISKEQRRLLLGLNVEVFLGFDNDVNEDEIIDMCKKFKKYQRVSYMKDTDGLLGKKDSPCDKGIRVYRRLLENRVRL